MLKRVFRWTVRNPQIDFWVGVLVGGIWVLFRPTVSRPFVNPIVDETFERSNLVFLGMWITVVLVFGTKNCLEYVLGRGEFGLRVAALLKAHGGEARNAIRKSVLSIWVFVGGNLMLMGYFELAQIRSQDLFTVGSDEWYRVIIDVPLLVIGLYEWLMVVAGVSLILGAIRLVYYLSTISLVAAIDMAKNLSEVNKLTLIRRNNQRAGFRWHVGSIGPKNGLGTDE